MSAVGLAVDNTESIIINVRNQMERFAAVNVTPVAVLMNSQHYRSLQAEVKYSMVKGNSDADTVNGLPIVISPAKDVIVCASPTQLDNAGLL